LLFSHSYPILYPTNAAGSRISVSKLLISQRQAR
jgi:hypothetical protein